MKTLKQAHTYSLLSCHQWPQKLLVEQSEKLLQENVRNCSKKVSLTNYVLYCSDRSLSPAPPTAWHTNAHKLRHFQGNITNKDFSFWTHIILNMDRL